jgi:hypothetical protein
MALFIFHDAWRHTLFRILRLQTNVIYSIVPTLFHPVNKQRPLSDFLIANDMPSQFSDIVDGHNDHFNAGTGFVQKARIYNNSGRLRRLVL